MKQVEIGNTGIEVPVMAYGTYHLLDKLDPRSAFESLGLAYEAGVRMFETADNYPAAEMVIGRAINEAVLPRDQIVIAGKTGIPASYYEAREGRERSYWTIPDRIRQKVGDGLWQMGIDRFDIFQLHMTGVEPEGFAERAETMTNLADDGKISEWGVSNTSLEQLEALLSVCDEHGFRRPVTIQNLGNILGVGGVGAVNLAIEEGMTMLAYGPLYHGALTDQTLDVIRDYLEVNMKIGTDELNKEATTRDALLASALELLTPIQDYARSRGKTLSQFALAQMANKPRTVVLNGMTRDQYVREAAQAARWDIDQEGDELLEKVHQLDNIDGVRAALINTMAKLRPYYQKL